MPSTPPPGRKYFTFFTLDTVLQSAFLFALSASCTFSASALAALIDVSRKTGEVLWALCAHGIMRFVII